MFSNLRTIVFIDKEKIRWAKCRVPSGKVFAPAKELRWSEENLRLALEDIDKNWPRRVRIVVGEEFSYVTRFRKDKKNKTTVDEARALIPEDLQDGWDSREEDDIVQVMAIQQKLFSLLQQELVKTDLQIEAVESESIAINRMLPNGKNKIVVFAKDDGKILLGASQDGAVLFTKIFTDLPSAEQVEEFLSYLFDRTGNPAENIYIQDKTGKLKNIFKSSNIGMKEYALDPILGICHKKDLKGRDKDVLNISLKKAVLAEDKKVTRSGLTLREKVLFVAFVVIVGGGALGVYYIQKARQNKAKLRPTSQTMSPQNDQAGLVWEK